VRPAVIDWAPSDVYNVEGEIACTVFPLELISNFAVLASPWMAEAKPEAPNELMLLPRVWLIVLKPREMSLASPRELEAMFLKTLPFS